MNKLGLHITNLMLTIQDTEEKPFVRELALEEVFKETKELLHKIIDRLEAREIPILFACIKEMSETDIDSLQQFLFDIIQSLNPDSIEEDLRNISSHLWAKTHTSFQLKKPNKGDDSGYAFL